MRLRAFGGVALARVVDEQLKPGADGDLATRLPVAVLRRRTTAVTGVVFRPDSEELAICSWEGFTIVDRS